MREFQRNEMPKIKEKGEYFACEKLFTFTYLDGASRKEGQSQRLEKNQGENIWNKAGLTAPVHNVHDNGENSAYTCYWN